MTSNGPRNSLRYPSTVAPPFPAFWQATLLPRRKRFSAKLTAVIEIPSIRLLQTLATCPLPTSPQEIALFPMHMNNDSSGLKVSSEHPAMKVKVRLTAPGTPPETGASMKSALEFLVARAAESSFAVAGSIVEESIKTDLDLASTKSPSRCQTISR
uniref:Uncharacterized protein n=1 Tax=Rhodosorus marinus TaxID=101924 RepID=A0A7S3EJS4_9RHOD